MSSALTPYTPETAHDLMMGTTDKHVIYFHKPIDRLDLVEPPGCLHLALALHRSNQRILDFFDMTLPANRSIGLVDVPSLDISIIKVSAWELAVPLVRQFCAGGT